MSDCRSVNPTSAAGGVAEWQGSGGGKGGERRADGPECRRISVSFPDRCRCKDRVGEQAVKTKLSTSFVHDESGLSQRVV
ncbi:MAG: hypothetical protein J6Y79_00365 [Paludibacteraceae bacterium]|nr:hypothetical protein [Paludibacteraceae bacterium]